MASVEKRKERRKQDLLLFTVQMSLLSSSCARIRKGKRERKKIYALSILINYLSFLPRTSSTTTTIMLLLLLLLLLLLHKEFMFLCLYSTVNFQYTI